MAACAEIEGLPSALAALAAILDRREATVLERVAAVELAQQRPPANTVAVQTEPSAQSDDAMAEALLARLKALEERMEGIAASVAASGHDHGHRHGNGPAHAPDRAPAASRPVHHRAASFRVPRSRSRDEGDGIEGSGSIPKRRSASFRHKKSERPADEGAGGSRGSVLARAEGSGFCVAVGAPSKSPRNAPSAEPSGAPASGVTPASGTDGKDPNYEPDGGDGDEGGDEAGGDGGGGGEGGDEAGGDDSAASNDAESQSSAGRESIDGSIDMEERWAEELDDRLSSIERVQVVRRDLR